MSPPTPLTTSIITVLSGSTRSCSGTLKVPDASHVHAVVSSPGAWQCTPKSLHDAFCVTSWPWTPRKAQTAPPNATKTLVVESHAAARRESFVPPSRMRIAATSGESRQIHAPQLMPVIRAAPRAGRRRAGASAG